MSGIQTNDEEFRKLSRNESEEPFIMLNLLRFKPGGGGESYARYMTEANKHVAAVGAEMIYLGKPNELLNGKDRWDLMMLVRYPSRKAFLEMANNPEYLKVHAYREEALEDAVLYATDPVKFRQFRDDKN